MRVVATCSAHAVDAKGHGVLLLRLQPLLGTARYREHDGAPFAPQPCYQAVSFERQGRGEGGRGQGGWTGKVCGVISE